MLVPRMATQCRAQRTQGVRIYGSKGFQGSWTLPGSLHAARPLFGSIRAPEAEYEQHPYRYPILWPRRTSISPVDVLHGSFRETVAKVVGRLVPDTNGSPPASYSSRLPLECPLPGQFDVSRYAAQLRGRQREDRLVRRVQYDTHPGRQRLPAIPPRSYTQIVLPNTSAPEDPGFIRHQAYIAKENVERPSTLQVKHRLRVRPPVCLVKLVALVLISFHSSFVNSFRFHSEGLRFPSNSPLVPHPLYAAERSALGAQVAPRFVDDMHEQGPHMR